MNRAWRTYLVSIGLAILVYFRLSPGSQSVLYNLIGLSAAGAMLFGAWRYRPEPQPAWFLLGLGVLSLAVGNVVFGESQPVPSLADMFYISAYPLLALGLLGLTPWRAHKGDVTGLIGATANAIIVGVLTWVFLIAPAGHTSGVSTVTRLVALGYPLMDVALIGLLVWAAGRDGFRRVPYAFLGIALVLFLVADSAYAVENFGTSYFIGGAVDAAWLLAYGFFGAALLHPALQGDRTPVAVAWGPPATQGRPVAVAAQAIHYQSVVAWSGRLVLGIGGVALLMGAAWGAGDVVLLSGAYGITGSLMMIAGSVSSAGVR